MQDCRLTLIANANDRDRTSLPFLYKSSIKIMRMVVKRIRNISVAVGSIIISKTGFEKNVCSTIQTTRRFACYLKNNYKKRVRGGCGANKMQIGELSLFTHELFRLNSYQCLYKLSNKLLPPPGILHYLPIVRYLTSIDKREVVTY